MIKAVLFDMDGVLVDADAWHFEALNAALEQHGAEPISGEEHERIYKALPTRKKLGMLTARKALPRELWGPICDAKQAFTQRIIAEQCRPDPEKVEMLKLLRRQYKIGVCSNSIRGTVELMLGRAGLLPYLDFFLSNEDVSQAKPSPAMYIKAFETLGLSPEECVIVEDSDVGKEAAVASGGVLCGVREPSEVNYYRVLRTILDADRVNVLIPAAGQGRRFAEAGYQHPKPLIDVEGAPMIHLVLENFRDAGRPIVLMQAEHIERYCAASIIKHLAPSAEVLTIHGMTAGAACTVLHAEPLIDNANELVLANSDQYVDYDMEAFLDHMRRLKADAGILTFRDDHPKWSYAKYDATGRVSEVAEKVVISDQATVGIYYSRKGSDFVKYAKQMIAKNIRVNNEFYVCPVFNQFIEDGKSVYIHEIHKSQMHGLGTPEDLTRFLGGRIRLAA